MPRKKKVEVDIPQEIVEAPEAEVVDVTPVVKEIEEAGETVEMIWVETVDALGRRMIQVPKK